MSDNVLLSHEISQRLGIPATDGSFYDSTSPIYHVHKWLYEDSARCFQLACDHNINVHQTFDGAKAYIRFRDYVVVEPWRNHPSKYITNNVAILKCLLELYE